MFFNRVPINADRFFEHIRALDLKLTEYSGDLNLYGIFDTEDKYFRSISVNRGISLNDGILTERFFDFYRTSDKFMRFKIYHLMGFDRAV